MRLKMTDGRSGFTFTISEDADRKECSIIRKSKNPVSAAIRIVKKRHGDAVKHLVPQQGVCLEGL